jgi:predicted nucleotidyltransferase component of viral defense system
MMLLPNKNDALHKAWLYRLLEAIADENGLKGALYFKGGTCAAMLGWLDRFSVDLDFDYAGSRADIPATRKLLEDIFKRLGLEVKDSSKNGLQYFLKYRPTGSSAGAFRNTLKIEATFPLFTASLYQPQQFVEIDRILTCQTKETMFAHKLVALMDRYKKTGHIAGRDIYDIHHFFMQGFAYNAEVIKQRSQKELKDFFTDLIAFVELKVSDKIITEDLSFLLSPDKFNQMRKILKRETVSLLRHEVEALS